MRKNRRKSELKVLLVDDHPLFCDGLKGVLHQLASNLQITSAGSVEESLEIIPDLDDLDLVLLDLNLPGINGLDGIQKVRHQLPSTPLIIISASEDRDKILLAIEKGAKGFIPKSSSSEVILSAVKLVLSGGVYLPLAALDEVKSKDNKHAKSNGRLLTPRQLTVLELLSVGHSNKSIANQLSMAENTVRVHVSAILKLLGANNRTEAGVAAKRLGLLPD